MDHNNCSKAVSVKNLFKKFESFVAVDKISFEVEKGTVFGLLGPNGAGKSTTMRMLCGILSPTSGEGHVAGCSIATQSELIKSQIGYMSQKFSLYEDLTVEENIDFFSGIYRVPKDKKASRKQEVIEMIQLKDYLHYRTSILPTGWKQRLALGCAILHKPSIIFLDEPTAGVDPISRRNFWQLIYHLIAQGMTVIVTTHYVEEAEYFNHIAMVYKGKLIAQGSPEFVKTELMQDKVLELVCEQPKEMMAPLYHSGKIKEVGLYGKSLHLVTDDIQVADQIVHATLGQYGIKIHSLQLISPSMEDVFVSLIDAHDRKDTQSTL